jgi:hypothetical protein
LAKKGARRRSEEAATKAGPGGCARCPSTGTNIFDIQDLPLAKPSRRMTDRNDGTQFGRLCGMGERSTVNILINRASVLTLLSATVAERLGFDRDEALSLARP